MLVCSGDFHGCTYSLWVGQELLKDLREKPRLGVGRSKKWEASFVLLDILGKQWYLLYFLYPDLWKLRKAEEELPYSTYPPKWRHLLYCLVIIGYGRRESGEMRTADVERCSRHLNLQLWNQDLSAKQSLMGQLDRSLHFLLLFSHHFFSSLPFSSFWCCLPLASGVPMMWWIVAKAFYYFSYTKRTEWPCKTPRISWSHLSFLPFFVIIWTTCEADKAHKEGVLLFSYCNKLRALCV